MMPPTLRWDPMTFALISVTCWVLGSVTSYTLGGYIHTFLILAVGMMLPRVVLGRKVPV